MRVSHPAVQIQGLPTVLLISDMRVVIRAEGALVADELEQLVEHHFFGGPEPVTPDLTSVARERAPLREGEGEPN